MRTLTLAALLALTLLVAAPAGAQPRGEATRSAEIAVPDPFAVPADRPQTTETTTNVRQRETTESAAPQETEQTEATEHRVLELKRAPSTGPVVPGGQVPPVPALELRGF